MNRDITIIRKNPTELLEGYNHFQPFSKCQITDVLKYATRNPKKITVSIDDALNLNKMTFQTMYDKANQRVAPININLNASTVDSVRKTLVTIQKQFELNLMDMIMVHYSYPAEINSVEVQERTQQIGELLQAFRAQTKQILQVDIPMVIQIKRQQPYSYLTTVEEECIDTFILSKLY